MKKRILKISALSAAVILIIGICIFANGLVGNPISEILAARTAKLYIAENYPDSDYVIESVDFSFKEGCYYAKVKSPSSIDSYFALYIGMDGKLRFDSYENSVANKSNTALRLIDEYRKTVDYVFDSPNFPFKCDIAYGLIEFDYYIPEDDEGYYQYVIPQESLVLDKQYDIAELGRQAGRVVVYVNDDVVTIERASEIMLEIKSLMDSGGVPFVVMDFVLQYPKSEDGRRSQEALYINNFPYAYIYEEDMTERVKASNDRTNAYFAEEDAKRAEAKS